jgi:hypothetical protein
MITTKDNDEAELNRLANIAPGTEFVLFKADKIAKASNVSTWSFK